MAVERLKKGKEPFTQVSNDPINNKRLSWKAVGIYTYLSSKPDNWEFSGHRIVEDGKDGVDGVYSALKELEDAGYIVRNRRSDGKVDYILNWTQDQSSVPETEVEEKPKKKRVVKRAYGKYKNVKLSDEEKQGLIEHFGSKDIALKWVMEVDAGIEEKGYKYKNFSLAIKNWAKRQKQWDKNKSQNQFAQTAQESDIARKWRKEKEDQEMLAERKENERRNSMVADLNKQRDSLLANSNVE